MLKGIGASQGYGIGSAVIIDDISLDYSAVKYSGASIEKQRLHNATRDYVDNTTALIENLKSSAGDKESEILQGHLTMLSDPFMLSQMEEMIEQGAVAESAVDTVCTMFFDMFSAVDDQLTRQRASDVKDIRDSLLKLLLNVNSVDISAVPSGSILVAKDFTPSMTSQINKDNVLAIVTEIGGVTSHSAILARAMGIPAVLSVVDAVSLINNGDKLIVDGFSGKIIKNPNQAETQQYAKRQEEYEKQKDELKNYFSKKTITKSGVVKKVYGNIGRAEDVQSVIENGGEGIGLFRTEFLFMDRDSQPTEQEQFEAYSTVARAMNDREIIIRTLDVGGDKAIDYLNIAREENPFLGHRAIRYCLDNEKLFKAQIRAILRAASYGKIKMLLPLITTVNEVKRARALILECENQLTHEGVAYSSVPLGVMIETPSAVLISDLLAKEVDFFSIGTNDLTGYTMAVDRGNAMVSNLYDVNQESVLRAIKITIQNAKKQGIMVGMCGEAAADTSLIPRLIEWGLDEFSVTPSSILQTRRAICECE